VGGQTGGGDKMHITIEVAIRENQYSFNPATAELTITAPIDIAVDADFGEVVRLLLQQAHDDYIEGKAGQEAE